ncbi:SAGA-associated factor 29 isoform X3 [Arachis ipaensis]|uniref:SAGA-associated factor 29 isoform X3 n=1 Tax=Arachis ipaensis TaxID=130454 RepID=UPI0007AF131E|nr:SAGA-associated factor 29 isoform X3 [Arachis ipaensis]XP_025658903.1 SAGA-associated factor 29 homolog A isoform X3 [Arachis hypogaea]
MMSSSDITGILDNSKELDRLRKEQEDILLEINRLHKKLQTAPEVVEKPGDNSLARLKILYTQAKDLSDSEAQISSLLINQLDTLLPSGQGQPRRRIEGNEQKRKRVKTESDISRMSNLKGEQVAARVTPRNADKDEWFVVKVIHFDKESKEVEVLDEEPGDDEEGSGQRQYKLPMGNIIPFPKSNDPSGAPDFPPGSHVLAVYPGTTALYKATVVHGHRKQYCACSGAIFFISHLCRGRQTTMCWNLMMMKKMGLCLKGRFPSTRWLLCQRVIANEFKQFRVGL